jgi:hypothetical protein
LAGRDGFLRAFGGTSHPRHGSDGAIFAGDMAGFAQTAIVLSLLAGGSEGDAPGARRADFIIPSVIRLACDATRP